MQGDVAGRAQQVHEDERDAARGDQRGHLRVEGQAADVVDEARARVQGGGGDFGLVGVHGQG